MEGEEEIPMELRRVLNNNTVLVIDDSGAESIVLGKAIGYGKRPGDLIDATQVTQTFLPDEANPIERLAAYLSDIPLDAVRVAHEIAELASQRLGLPMTQSLMLPIADHLAFAVARLRQQISADYPLRWEVAQLYPKELSIGREGVQIANRRLNVELPGDEAIPIALHLVNSQFTAEGLQHTVRMTEKITQVLHIVESGMGISADQDAMSVARFITHLRYLFVRLEQQKQFTNSPKQVLDAIREAHPEAWLCAQRIRLLLETGGDVHLTHDEVLYLTLHVARLVSDLRA